MARRSSSCRSRRADGSCRLKSFEVSPPNDARVICLFEPASMACRDEECQTAVSKRAAAASGHQLGRRSRCAAHRRTAIWAVAMHTCATRDRDGVAQLAACARQRSGWGQRRSSAARALDRDLGAAATRCRRRRPAARSRTSALSRERAHGANAPARCASRCRYGACRARSSGVKPSSVNAKSRAHPLQNGANRKEARRPSPRRSRARGGWLGALLIPPYVVSRSASSTGSDALASKVAADLDAVPGVTNVVRAQDARDDEVELVVTVDHSDVRHARRASHAGATPGPESMARRYAYRPSDRPVLTVTLKGTVRARGARASSSGGREARGSRRARLTPQDRPSFT